MINSDIRAFTPPTLPNDIVTEDSAATAFMELFAGRLRYCHDSGAWYEWDGNVWKRNSVGRAFHWARELARELSEDQNPKVRKITGKTAFPRGVEYCAQRDPKLAVTSEVWDSDGFLIGTPGGTVDLRTGELRASMPEDGITKMTAVPPADRPDCPRFGQFLMEATGGDIEVIRFLQRLAGYCLTGSTREHIIVFVYGPGGNGKSVFMNCLTYILRQYATIAAMETFVASKSNHHPTELAMLRAARLVAASETEADRQWAESRIKQLTGGDPITARFMRQDFFTYQPQFKLVVIGNHQPALHTVDDAVRRRFAIVPFIRKPEVPDPDLEEKLRAEAPGILRWMIEGCIEWQELGGLHQPETVLRETETYFEEQDVFGLWLAEACEIDPGNDHQWQTTTELFASWSNYAEKAGEPHWTSKAFATVMKRRGFPKKKTNYARGFSGIRLREPRE